MKFDRITSKSIAIIVSLATFIAIIYLPFHFWNSSLDQLNRTSQREAEHLNWLLGMTMIIWFPLISSAAAAIAISVFYLLWPKRRVTIGEIAARKARQNGT